MLMIRSAYAPFLMLLALSDCSSDDAEECTYPKVQNPKECPANYHRSLHGQPCSTPNLSCRYPGAGDLMVGSRCQHDAALYCSEGPAIAGPDGGPRDPGGRLQWRASQ